MKKIHIELTDDDADEVFVLLERLVLAIERLEQRLADADDD
jgi:hypothetical protein